MNEQPKRMAGLRRICQAQEGRRSPCYQRHEMRFHDLFPNPTSEFSFEVEATDLIIPYPRETFFEEANSPSPLFPLYQFGMFLNDSDTDILTIDRFHVPKIINFPFYKVTFRALDWPLSPFEAVFFKFYTFTDPRIIQALEIL